MYANDFVKMSTRKVYADYISKYTIIFCWKSICNICT